MFQNHTVKKTFNNFSFLHPILTSVYFACIQEALKTGFTIDFSNADKEGDIHGTLDKKRSSC